MKPSVFSGAGTSSPNAMKLVSRFCGYAVVAMYLAFGDAAQAQSIISIGVPGRPSRAWDVSDDGNTVVGALTMSRPPPLSGTYTQAFKWSRGLGLQYYFPSQSVYLDTQAVAISGNGSTLIVSGSNSAAVVMRDPFTIIDVGGRPAALAKDGKTIVGSFQDPAGKTEAFRWTDSGGFLALGLPNGYEEAAATVITREGSTVFGLLGPAGEFRSDVPFRWTAGEGMLALPFAAGTFAPIAVSDDGAVLVGTDGAHAARWNASSGAVQLPSAGGYFGGAAEDISGNAQLVVGSVGNTMPERAVLWDGDGHPWLLDAVLPQLGIPTGGWTLTSANAISQDGRYVVGNGIFDGNQTAFLIDFGPTGFSAPIPEPSAYGGLGALLLLALRTLRNRKRTRVGELHRGACGDSPNANREHLSR